MSESKPASSFKPQSLDTLENGQLLKLLNADLAELQQDLLAFARRYGDAAKKAAIELTLKIKVECVNPSEGQYQTTTDIATKTPKRPKGSSLAFVIGEGDDQTLFARRGDDSPGQTHMEFEPNDETTKPKV